MIVFANRPNIDSQYYSFNFENESTSNILKFNVQIISSDQQNCCLLLLHKWCTYELYILNSYYKKIEWKFQWVKFIDTINLILTCFLTSWSYIEHIKVLIKLLYVQVAYIEDIYL